MLERRKQTTFAGRTRTFKQRLKEHKRKAAQRSNGGFYSKFASQEAKHTDKEWTGVYFEDLAEYVALAFDFEKDSAKVASLLHWSNSTIECMKRSTNWDEASEGMDCKAQWAAYLIELMYDLCIDVFQNVSRGPGFEGPLGVTDLD